MNPIQETQHNPSMEDAAVGGSQSGVPHNWREALMTLIAARIQLIRLEARQSAKDHAGMVVRLLVAAFSLLFGWMLLLAGGITALSACTGWAWHWVALSTAALHILLAVVLLRTIKSTQPSFQATLAEFQKDREWIENFQKHPKSSN
jgi:uncharacterized membrane protein YqjE